MIWFCGTSSIANLDMQKFAFVESKGLLIDDGPQAYSIPYRCVAKNSGRTLLLAFFLNSESNILYTDPQITDPDNYTLKEIFPSCKAKNYTGKIDFLVGRLDCMELSFNKEFAFLGGGTIRNGGPSSKAIISAVRFDQTLRVLKEKIYMNEPVRQCTAMRRFENSDCLAVGFYKSMFVERFTTNGFQTLYRFDNIHAGKVNG